MKHIAQTALKRFPAGLLARIDATGKGRRHAMRNTILARLVHVLLLAFVFLATIHAVSMAQETSAAPAADEKFQTFIKMLDDPDIRARLEAVKKPPADTPDAPVSATAEQLSELEARYRGHLSALRNAIPRIPDELAKAASIVSTDVNAGRPGKGIAIVMLLIALGYAAEWLFRRAVLKARQGDQTQGSRILLEVAPLFVFSIASAGFFLAFDWPPLLRKVVLTYLFAFILFRVAVAFGRVLVAPDIDADETALKASPRMVPVSNVEARFWHRRLKLAAGYSLFAWATVSLMPALGFSIDVVRLASYVLGLGLLAMAIEIVWRRPGRSATTQRVSTREWLLTIYVVLLWGLWVAGFTGLLWLGIYALLLPGALTIAGQAAQTLAEGRDGPTSAHPIRTAMIVRGVRALVILLAVLWLGLVWRMNPSALAEGNNAINLIVRGLLHGVVILLVADLLWHLAKAYIGRTLELAAVDDTVSTDEAARRSRLRTLLPIFRNMLAVLLGAVAVLMVLSGLGVQIAPLIAGAGIFGVAIGFGSQTLVKDVLSGVFFMLDDAFRVGEYIESGSYKGTVESFSLRSVKLRHHRGPVFTVPFGDLGAVQNMSRDWVIDKFRIRVPFDTDIAKVKKLLKGVGAELKADPELGPEILETVKMKGVEEIGDFGIQLSFAFMAKPGHQSVVRRRAYTMIQQAFAANGINFAQPTVQVGSDEKQAAAAAANVISLAQQKAAQTAQGGE
jgi:small-conductance mechanosensitive channel